MMRLIVVCLAILISFVSLAPLRGESQDPDQDSPVPSTAASDATSQAAIPEHLDIEGREVGHRVESREGEICVVCGKPIAISDVTYMVEGQRVAVHRGPCLGALAAQPTKWLSKLKPHGALLDAAAAKAGLSPGWLIFGAYVLLGLIFSALAAHRAFHVGRNPLLWLVVGLVANVVGYGVLVVLPRQETKALGGVPAGLGKVAATYSPEACPACGAENHPSARVCSACGAVLTPRIISEAQRARLTGINR